MFNNGEEARNFRASVFGEIFNPLFSVIGIVSATGELLVGRGLEHRTSLAGSRAIPANFGYFFSIFFQTEVLQMKIRKMRKPRSMLATLITLNMT